MVINLSFFLSLTCFSFGIFPGTNHTVSCLGSNFAQKCPKIKVKAILILVKSIISASCNHFDFINWISLSQSCDLCVIALHFNKSNFLSVITIMAMTSEQDLYASALSDTYTTAILPYNLTASRTRSESSSSFDSINTFDYQQTNIYGLCRQSYIVELPQDEQRVRRKKSKGCGFCLCLGGSEDD